MLYKRLFIISFVLLGIVMVASVVLASVEDLSVNQKATISSGKTMLNVSGTVTCSEGQFVGYLFVRAIQQRGNRQVTGSVLSFADNGGYCTGNPISWHATIAPLPLYPEAGDSLSGLWQPGPLSVLVESTVCSPVEYEWGVDCAYYLPMETYTIDARIHAGQ